MEPVSAIVVSTIAQLAFNEFIKSGAGELAKQSLGSAIDLAKRLRDRIQAKFQGNDRAEKAIAELKQQGTPEALTKVTKYLDLEMTEDQTFDAEIRQIAQQIINIQNQTVDRREYNNYGRDLINIETIQGDAKIGGS